jgi:AraC-like DNA-binding protein
MSGIATWLWVLIGGLILAIVGTLLGMRRHHSRRIRELEEKLLELGRQIAAAREPAPAVELPEKLAAVLPPEVAHPAPAEPGKVTVEFTHRVQDLLERKTVELLEYQALTKHAVLHIQQHLDENLSAADLAEAVHTSLRTLQRALKETLDCSPSEILWAVKMHEAKQLLKLGGLNVSEAGYRVGFENPDHFSRRFKAYYGVPPSTIRQWRAEQDGAA